MLVRELTAKRASVDHYRAECERLRKKNHQLIQQMVDKEKANFEVNDFWETQVGEKDKMISQLKDQILKKEEEYEKEKNIAEEIFEAKIKWMESENDDIENKLSAENAKLTNELTNLKNFAEQKENLEQQLEQLAAEKKELEERQSETVVKMERKFIEEKARLQKDINKKLQAFKKASEEKVNENLDASTKRILMQNRQMADELRLHVQETNELLKTKSRLETERKRVSRDADLQKACVEEATRSGAKKERGLKECQDKIKTLERSLSRVVHEFEAERVRLVESARADAEQQEQVSPPTPAALPHQSTPNLGTVYPPSSRRSLPTNPMQAVDGLQAQLRSKQREVKTVRQLAKDILRQRSDVEEFFLDSLEYVREQALAQHREQQRVEQACRCPPPHQSVHYSKCRHNLPTLYQLAIHLPTLPEPLPVSAPAQAQYLRQVRDATLHEGVGFPPISKPGAQQSSFFRSAGGRRVPFLPCQPATALLHRTLPSTAMQPS